MLENLDCVSLKKNPTFFAVGHQSEKIYAHHMVRTDSKEQTLDAFIKKSTNQDKESTRATNQNADDKMDVDE